MMQGEARRGDYDASIVNLIHNDQSTYRGLIFNSSSIGYTAPIWHNATMQAMYRSK